MDERGNVVGVVSAKLSARAALAASGALPENVNYAVKSSFLLGFLESAPEVSAKLKEPETKERKFEDVVKISFQSGFFAFSAFFAVIDSFAPSTRVFLSWLGRIVQRRFAARAAGTITVSAASALGAR